MYVKELVLENDNYVQSEVEIPYAKAKKSLVLTGFRPAIRDWSVIVKYNVLTVCIFGCKEQGGSQDIRQAAHPMENLVSEG